MSDVDALSNVLDAGKVSLVGHQRVVGSEVQPRALGPDDVLALGVVLVLLVLGLALVAKLELVVELFVLPEGGVVSGRRSHSG